MFAKSKVSSAPRSEASSSAFSLARRSSRSRSKRTRSSQSTPLVPKVAVLTTGGPPFWFWCATSAHRSGEAGAEAEAGGSSERTGTTAAPDAAGRVDDRRGQDQSALEVVLEDGAEPQEHG